VKPVSCRLGRHKWKTLIEHGDELRVCEECGKQGDSDLDQPPMSSTDLTPRWAGGNLQKDRWRR
jgi:hypothetical protein